MARMAELQNETRVTGRPLTWQVSPEDLQNLIARAQAERAKTLGEMGSRALNFLWQGSGLAAATAFLNRFAVKPLLRGLRQAHARRSLSQLDDRLLLDIGIRRDQICEVVAKTGQNGADPVGPSMGLRVWLAMMLDRRRTIRQLESLSNRMLEDIGIERADIREIAAQRVAAKYAKPARRPASDDAVKEAANPLLQWQLSRKAAGEMARMDPDILADIGYVKGDVDWVPEVLAQRKLKVANRNFRGFQAA